MKTLNIKVTRDMIKRGLNGSCDKCPIALAIKEEYPDAMVAVARQNVYFRLWEDKDEKVFPLSKSAQEFVENFDWGRAVVPQNFRLKEKEEQR